MPKTICISERKCSFKHKGNYCKNIACLNNIAVADISIELKKVLEERGLAYVTAKL